jgi:hypothetical protein
MTLQEVKEQLGLKPGELLQNLRGQVADLLEVQGENAVLGVLDTGKTIQVPLGMLVKDATTARLAQR